MRVLTALLTSLVCLPAFAADLPGKTGFALRVSTLGLGAEVSRTLPVANLTGRLAWHAYTYETDDSIQGIPYDVELDLDSVTALIDWRPWGQVTHLTAGIVFNNNKHCPLHDNAASCCSLARMCSSFGNCERMKRFR